MVAEQRLVLEVLGRRRASVQRVVQAEHGRQQTAAAARASTKTATSKNGRRDARQRFSAARRGPFSRSSPPNDGRADSKS